ncbi:diacylglycerol/lipid kinase family protein [Halocola ammonii]
MKRLKTVLIVNPFSGTTDCEKTVQLVEKTLDSSKFELAIERTVKAGHAAEIAEQSSKKGMDLVIVAGGDGTVNEVGTALLNSATALAILPCGSGNGVARSLGIPVNLRKAITHLNEKAKLQKIDTATFNDRVFIGLCGIGFDALVSHEFHNFKSRGLKGYFKAFTNKILQFKPREFTIETRDQKFVVNGFLAVVANSNQFGNNAKISPESKMDDGLLNLTLIKSMPKVLVPAEIVKLFSGVIHKSPHAFTLTSDWFRISSTFDKAHIDGEPINCSAAVEVAVHPRSLTVMA